MDINIGLLMKFQPSLKYVLFEFISMAKLKLLFNKARAGFSRFYLVNP